jgi:hypothetical protein
MLEQHKGDALVGIVVQYVIEASINKFMQSFKCAYSKVANEDIIASTHNDLWARMEGAEVTITAKTGTLHKLKLVPKAFKQMAKNAGQSNNISNYSETRHNFFRPRESIVFNKFCATLGIKK